MPGEAGVAFLDVGFGHPGTHLAAFSSATFQAWVPAFYARLAAHMRRAAARVGCAPVLAGIRQRRARVVEGDSAWPAYACRAHGGRPDTPKTVLSCRLRLATQACSGQTLSTGAALS